MVLCTDHYELLPLRSLSLSPSPTSFLVRAPFADIIQHSVQRGPSPFYPRRPIVFHYIPFYLLPFLLPGYSRVAPPLGAKLRQFLERERERERD